MSAWGRVRCGIECIDGMVDFSAYSISHTVFFASPRTGALPQTLVCPRLSTACPDLYCPFQCAGRGVCNYDHTVNGTMQPKCECFDATDTSPGCSDSLLPNGDFFDNGAGLFDQIEENFFDPLIAVFVDHPDKWTTSSWAWAAGLILVFLVMLLCICSAFWPEKDKTNPLQKSYMGGAPAGGSSSRGSSPKKLPSSPRKQTSPRARSESTQRRPSTKTSSAPQTLSSIAYSASHQMSPSDPRSASSYGRSPMESSSLQSPAHSGVARTSSTFREATTSSYRSAISPARQSQTSPNNYQFNLSSPPSRKAKVSGKNYQRCYSSSDMAEM